MPSHEGSPTDQLGQGVRADGILEIMRGGKKE